jgi:hypothetical protein
MLKSTARFAALICLVPCVVGCVPLLTMAGSAGSAIQVGLQIDRIKLIGDGVSLAGTGKSITDHALSKAVDADCRLLNVVSGTPVCVSRYQPVRGSEHEPSPGDESEWERPFSGPDAVTTEAEPAPAVPAPVSSQPEASGTNGGTSIPSPQLP